MPDINEVVQKAFYLGVGIANYANEKAKEKVQEITIQANKLAEEMIARGEMEAGEARKFVDEMIKKAQQQNVEASPDKNPQNGPRQIEILDVEIIDEEDSNPSTQNVDSLRDQVKSLQEELRRLKRD